MGQKVKIPHNTEIFSEEIFQDDGWEDDKMTLAFLRPCNNSSHDWRVGRKYLNEKLYFWTWTQNYLSLTLLWSCWNITWIETFLEVFVSDALTGDVSSTSIWRHEAHAKQTYHSEEVKEGVGVSTWNPLHRVVSIVCVWSLLRHFRKNWPGVGLSIFSSHVNFCS